MNFTSILGDFLKTYRNPKIGSTFFIGFSCGLPFLLTLTILDLWLKECGVSNTVIGLFTLLHWPFTLKFLWAPFIDKYTLPFFPKKFGRLRGWAVSSQLLLFIGVWGMSCSSPLSSPLRLILCASLVAFADGCQDISLYAYQLDRAKKDLLGPVAGVVIFGYKTGMFFAKSSALYLAYYFGWNTAYLLMAVAILICAVFICCIREPDVSISSGGQLASVAESYASDSNSEFARFFKKTIFECLVCPFKIFMKRKNWKSLIALVIFFKVGYILTQKMAKPFYMDMGFSILEIANVVQVFGTLAAMIGGMIGGYLIKKFALYRVMFYAAVAHALSCIAYLLLSKAGHSVPMLYITVFVENVTEGTMGASFIAFLYSLCNIKYCATQYALLWAFYDFGGMCCRIVSGAIADILGWTNFFLFVPLTFVPSLLILRKMVKTEAKRV
ncbi:MAG: MFS transporter [Holosporaceae bacterium]|jgi:PAT family beta-lactamase induction signal transducer AmpG|nr:MFS transporter [Holosporaceae bacterium]